MIQFCNTTTHGWDAAVRGMRNPMNSWDKSDSMFSMGDTFVGENDLALMKKLVKAGSDHSKFMRMLVVYCDITAPLYWWKEYDTYKVGTVANSCSTMHKIHAKPFIIDDFSHEHLFGDGYMLLYDIVGELNIARGQYLATNDKKWWHTMIQLLPSSYNQMRTVELNYAVLRNMYHARKNHKLDEWHTFCEWVESLPYAEELITPCE